MMVVGLVVVAVIIIFLISTYNILVGKRNRVKEALAAIDVYLQNRFDALTQIAETVVAYAKHEKETLVQVTSMRQQIASLPASADKVAQFEKLEAGLRSINVQAEAYPELKADQNYLHLQRTINELEEKLSASRRTYNANVTDYNTSISSIPTNLVAGMFNFKPEQLLVISEEKKADVDIKNILRG